MPIKNGWRRIEKDKGLAKQTIWSHPDGGKIKIFTKEDYWFFEDEEGDITAERNKSDIIEVAEEYKENNPVPEEEYGKYDDTLFSIMIPKTYNNGEKVPEEKLQKLLKPLIQRFGGVTVDPVEGHWQNPQTGQVMQEENMQVIMAREGDDGVPIGEDEQFLKNMADKIGDKLGQAEVLVMEEPSEVSFIKGNFTQNPEEALEDSPQSGF